MKKEVKKVEVNEEVGKVKLKQINKGYKCPNCKMFGLQPIFFDVHGNELSIHHSSYTVQTPLETKILRCRNCYAEFVEVK